MARLALSLTRLRDQVNAAAPFRDKSSDGWIGDRAHAARRSDHNPNSRGVVCALDLTHDPKGGFDAHAFAEAVRVSGDPRINYVISDYKIANSGKPWRKYRGSNPHSHHTHVSVHQSSSLYDDGSDWGIGLDKANVVKRAVAAVKNSVVEPVQYPTLRRGSNGADVRRLQELLNVAVDGDFGPKTRAAVIKHQKQHKLVPDGIVGPYTWRSLGA